MDGRGRLAQPLKRLLRRFGLLRADPAGAAGTQPRGRRSGRLPAGGTSRITRFVRNWSARMADLRPPRFGGAAASALLILASIGYGVVKGGHVPMIVGVLKDTRDAAANAAGFRIAAVSLSGEKQVSRAEIFTAAGVTERASLLFQDIE